MQEHRSAAKRSGQYDREGSNYNPFRRIRNRYRRPHLDRDDGRLSHQQLSSPPTTSLIREDAPRIYGQLFSCPEIPGDNSAIYESTALRPVLATSSTEKPSAQIDEEKSSVPRAEAGPPPKYSLRQMILPQWKLSGIGSLSQDKETFESNYTAQGHCRADPVPIRKRRVIVVEYGNTDNVTEGAYDVVAE